MRKKKAGLYAIGQRQLNLLMGTLLGDASFPKMAVRQKNRAIRCEHVADQKDYAIWKAEQIGLDWTPFERSRFDKRTGKTYASFTACLKSHPGFNALYDRFCKEDKKVVTR